MAGPSTTEPIPLAVIEAGVRIIKALTSVEDDGEASDPYAAEVPIGWCGEPTPWVVIPDEHGGYGLAVRLED